MIIVIVIVIQANREPARSTSSEPVRERTAETNRTQAAGIPVSRVAVASQAIRRERLLQQKTTHTSVRIQSRIRTPLVLFSFARVALWSR